jgi:prepilin-type N-terminal cleavage/methylation domain-containing protein
MPLRIRQTDRRRVGSAGFTLLELVVVVCIAAVLMSLLLPALSSAKEKSRRSVCSENIRQDVLALINYGDDFDMLLPKAVDNQGDYHSIVLSDATFANMKEYLGGESNTLYCPNLVYETGKMGGYDPESGYTIGYSYLAAETIPAIPQGPSMGWSGPQKTTQSTNIIADANYWSTISGKGIAMAPHTSRGGSVISLVSVLPAASAPPAPTAVPTSTTLGAMGGNIGSLDGSVLWHSIRSLSQYQASSDGSSMGNW